MTKLGWLAAGATVAATLLYLHDPPWIAKVTSGLRPWEQDPPGTFFRWTTGRATFFVPSSASELTLPLKSVFPGHDGGPVTVDVRVDDRWLATITLTDPSAWERPRMPLGRQSGHRRYRRIDLRVSRVMGPLILGVMTGEVLVDGAPLPH